MPTDCEICGKLPDDLTITTLYDSGAAPESFPPEVQRLLRITDFLLTCPGCGSYFGLRRDTVSHMGGPEHDEEETLWRYSPVGALLALARVPQATAELAKHEAAMPSVIAALERELASQDKDTSSRAARELTLYHHLKNHWDIIETLLKDPKRRPSVLDAIPGSANPPESTLRLLETFLDDAKCRDRAARILSSIDVHHGTALVSILPALFARLDSDESIVRGRVCEMLAFHVSARWSRRSDEKPDLPPPPGSDGLLPLLLRHLESPKTTWNGSWKGSTSSLASSALQNLAYRNVAVGREILDAVAKMPKGGKDRDYLESDLRRWLGVK